MKDMFIRRSAAVKVNFSTVPISYLTRILTRSHDRAQNDNRPYHFCAKNEYIDGQFLAGGCGSWQRQVANRADVVFTDTPSTCLSDRLSGQSIVQADGQPGPAQRQVAGKISVLMHW